VVNARVNRIRAALGHSVPIWVESDGWPTGTMADCSRGADGLLFGYFPSGGGTYGSAGRIPQIGDAAVRDMSGNAAAELGAFGWESERDVMVQFKMTNGNPPSVDTLGLEAETYHDAGVTRFVVVSGSDTWSNLPYLTRAVGRAMAAAN
jgi:hypothetical protein